MFIFLLFIVVAIFCNEYLLVIIIMTTSHSELFNICILVMCLHVKHDMNVLSCIS